MQQVNELCILDHIFNLDLGNGTWFSEILRATGSRDKPRVLKIIRTLRQAGLLEANRTRKQGIKKILKLTRLGVEFKKFVADIAQFKSSYAEFYDSANTNFYKHKKIGIHKLEIEMEGILKEESVVGQFFDSNKLRSDGWKEDEIRFFEKWDKGAEFTQSSSSKNFFLCLILRYAIIISGYNPNEKAKEILTKIIVDEINHELSSLTYSTTLIYLLFKRLLASVTDDINRTYISYNLISSKHLGNETKNLLNAQLSLMNDNKNSIEPILRLQIEDLKKKMSNELDASKSSVYENLIALYADTVNTKHP